MISPLCCLWVVRSGREPSLDFLIYFWADNTASNAKDGQARTNDYPRLAAIPALLRGTDRGRVLRNLL
jgi:hypothetical protein